MGYRYRCTKRGCDKRVTLGKKKEEYVKEVVCSHCGSNLYLDKYRAKKEKKNACQCDGYHFPHQKNSPFCINNPVGPTEEQYKERYGYE